MAITFGPRTTPHELDGNIFQGNQPTCAIRSQEIVMRDFGIQIPQEELVKYAEEHGWFDGGTPEECMANLLETVHVSTHAMDNAGIEDLVKELNAGHRVIVAVDAHEIWRDRGIIGNWIADHFVDPNHALIVTSLNVDLEDPSHSTVLLTDPGSGEIIECPYSRYAHAWGDSNCHMVATDEAAPYQYNPDTGKMEFSDFATEYSITEFPFSNSFSDIYQIAEAEDYQPEYGIEDNVFTFEDIWSNDDYMVPHHDQFFQYMGEEFAVMTNDDTMSPIHFGDIDNLLAQEPLEFDFGTLDIPQIDDVALCNSESTGGIG